MLGTVPRQGRRRGRRVRLPHAGPPPVPPLHRQTHPHRDRRSGKPRDRPLPLLGLGHQRPRPRRRRARVRASSQSRRRVWHARAQVELRSRRSPQARLHGQLGVAVARVPRPQPVLLDPTPRPPRRRSRRQRTPNQTAALPLPRRGGHGRAWRSPTHRSPPRQLPVPRPLHRRARPTPSTARPDGLIATTAPRRDSAPFFDDALAQLNRRPHLPRTQQRSAARPTRPRDPTNITPPRLNHHPAALARDLSSYTEQFARG